MRKQTTITLHPSRWLMPSKPKGARGITSVLFLLILSFILTSCSPQKRLAHLLKNHPELCITDTIKLTTPVPIPAKNAEFIVNYTYRDTLINLYSNDSIKLSYSVINDSIIKVFIHVPADTIFITQNIPVEKIKIVKPDNWGLLIEKIPYVAIALIAFAFAGLFFRKNSN